jgi:hypothetical protein
MFRSNHRHQGAQYSCLLMLQLYFNWLLLTTATLASSNNVLPDDCDCTEICRSCFNVNFNVNFKIVFKSFLLCLSWWMRKLCYLFLVRIIMKIEFSQQMYSLIIPINMVHLAFIINEYVNLKRMEWTTFNFLNRYENKPVSNITKILPVGADLFIRTEGQTDVTRIIITFGNFVKATKLVVIL